LTLIIAYVLNRFARFLYMAGRMDFRIVTKKEVYQEYA
jgi:hypothetical protein